jgi:hypothetical protein
MPTSVHYRSLQRSRQSTYNDYKPITSNLSSRPLRCHEGRRKVVDESVRETLVVYDTRRVRYNSVLVTLLTNVCSIARYGRFTQSMTNRTQANSIRSSKKRVTGCRDTSEANSSIGPSIQSLYSLRIEPLGRNLHPTRHKAFTVDRVATPLGFIRAKKR